MKGKAHILKYRLFLSVVLGLFILSCETKSSTKHGGEISVNQENITRGSKIFNTQCSSCHSFKSKVIGPNLSGVTRSVATDWLKKFIYDSKKLIEAKDERAVALFKKYKVYMPAFAKLNEQEVNDVLSYMHTFAKIEITRMDTTRILKDPIPEKIESSGKSMHLEFLAQVPASSEESPRTRINKMGYEVSSGRLFVNDLRGYLYELKSGKPQLYLNLKEKYSNFYQETGIGSGFGSFAFHPDYNTNGLFYTTHTELPNNKIADFQLPDGIKNKVQYVVTEWHAATINAAVFSGTQRELMRVDFVTEGHGLQEIAFNPSVKKGDVDYGKLYICVGDGVAVQLGYPQVVDKPGKEIWGTILRIDPLGASSANHNYGIPLDNPFVNTPDKRDEIWATGFRNPNRLAWDYSGRLLASDVGQTNIEEINLVEAGGFYGWPIREGSFVIAPKENLDVVYALPENDADYGVKYPIIAYDHDEGPAICGGYCVNTNELKGNYIFGDIPTGRVFIAAINRPTKPVIQELGIVFNGEPSDLYKLTESNRVDLKFGLDLKGTLYVFTKADGKIYKVIDILDDSF